MATHPNPLTCDSSLNMTSPKVLHPLYTQSTARNDPSTMEKEKNKMTETIINLTLEIIYLLTAEDYTVVKKSDKHVTPGVPPCVSGGRSTTQDTVVSPPHQSLIYENGNAQKIIQLSNKITELLSGEVPVRCQDVTVYLSMEEWEYMEGHKDQYKDVLMEDPRPLTPPDEHSRDDSPEDYARLSDSPHGSEDIHDVADDDQGEDLINSTAELIVKEEDDLCMTTYGEDTEDFSAADYFYADNVDGHIPTYGEVKVELSDTSGEHSFLPHPSYICTDQPFDSKETFYDHSEKGKSFQCFECKKCFKQKFNLMAHIRTHNDNRAISCSECGRCFTRKASLVSHERIHTGEKPFSCATCGKCFAWKTSLVSHERIHIKEKPFSCSDCGKGFMHRSRLVMHQRIHNGEKPFSCADCGRRFTHKSVLVEHQKSHTGEQPFSCSECGTGFDHKYRLVMHQRIHSREKLFSCSECGKGFRRKSSFIRHQIVHTGERPFSCSQCGQCFTQKWHLISHYRIHMGEKL
ncbi:uncharacterized protein LOC143806122 isoform X1 [Ranitomeya variabilis]|uniref:uncharacterized protein LOC143806122 isoform X1 n=1 Tax=Ranitomeya variabilis TaxID=490064 RepID=UPI004056698E